MICHIYNKCHNKCHGNGEHSLFCRLSLDLVTSNRLIPNSEPSANQSVEKVLELGAVAARQKDGDRVTEQDKLNDKLLYLADMTYI